MRFRPFPASGSWRHHTASTGFEVVYFEKSDSGPDESWHVRGCSTAPYLDGCFDVDLESSAMTNTFLIHRVACKPDVVVSAPAVFVRAEHLAIERLEQTYRFVEQDDAETRFHYTSPAFEYEAELRFDQYGLIVEYPEIASRTS